MVSATQKRTFQLIKSEKQFVQPPFESEPDVIPLHRACELLQRSDKTLRRLINAGEFPGFKIGRAYYVTKQALIQYVTMGGGIHE